MNIPRISIIFITIDLSRMISLTNIKHFRSQSSLTFFYPIRINSRGKRSNQKLISSGQVFIDTCDCCIFPDCHTKFFHLQHTSHLPIDQRRLLGLYYHNLFTPSTKIVLEPSERPITNKGYYYEPINSSKVIYIQFLGRRYSSAEL